MPDDFLWKALFTDTDSHWHESKQAREIQNAHDTAESAMDTAVKLHRENEALRQQLARQNLILQTLVRWHIKEGHFDTATFGVMVTRTDLADGFEDGGLGPDRSMHAPKCTHCGRSVNPTRTYCVFCGETVPEQPTPAEAPERLVSCTRCGDRVPESHSYFGDNGLVCEPCFGG